MIPRKVSKMLAMVHKALHFWLQNTCDLISYSPAMLGSFLFFNKPCMFLLPGLCLMLLLPGSLVPLGVDMVHYLTFIQASTQTSLDRGFCWPLHLKKHCLLSCPLFAFFIFLGVITWKYIARKDTLVCMLLFSLLLSTNLAKLHESRDSVLFTIS